MPWAGLFPGEARTTGTHSTDDRRSRRERPPQALFRGNAADHSATRLAVSFTTCVEQSLFFIERQRPPDIGHLNVTDEELLQGLEVSWKRRTVKAVAA